METCWIRRGNIGIGNGVIRDSLWGQYLWSYTQHRGERGETYVTRFRIFFLYSELISNRLSQYSDTGVNNDFRQRWSGFLTFLKNRFHVPPRHIFDLIDFMFFPSVDRVTSRSNLSFVPLEFIKLGKRFPIFPMKGLKESSLSLIFESLKYIFRIKKL